MPWVTGCLLLLLIAGFAKLSTVVVNRLLAIPQQKPLIAVTESLQFLVMASYAIVVVRILFRSGLSSLADFFYRDSSGILLIAVILPGAVGFLLLVRSAIAYQRYRPPDCLIAVDSEVVDVRQNAGHGAWTETFVGRRPMRRLALLPGNEQFTVEVATKTFTLPRLPTQWDGVSIVHLSDMHFRGAVARPYFEFVCERAKELNPDLFVFTGDLLDDITLLDWLPETLGRLRAPLGQYFILGNHDWYLDASSIRTGVERMGWTDVSGKSLEIRSQQPAPPIILAGDETPWMGAHPELDSAPADRFRVLLSHTPDNIEWAQGRGVDLMLSGHTHGGQIRLPVIGPVYSPSRYGCRFASGVFWLEPTLLYVSRGISGREPIRYQCPPELTKLVLRCTTQPATSTRV